MDAATAWAEAMKFSNRPNPYPYYEELRKTPVAKVSDHTYVVTGYPEALALAHDPRISSDISRSPSGLFGEKQAAIDAAQLDVAEAAQARDWSMLVADPPEHDTMRRQFMRHFGPPHAPDLIPSMEAMVIELANDLLDKVKARGGTRMDVVEDFSYPIPVSVIFRVMGAPIADEPKFHGWVMDFMQGADVGPEADTEEGRAATAKAAASMNELGVWVHELVDRLSREPGPGLLSAALHDDGPDGPVSKTVAEANALLLMIAGHDSTVNTISNCIMTMLRSPGSWDLVAGNRDLIPRTVEEVQRLQGSVQFFPSRWATADIEIAGTRIPAGSAVFLVWAAANRDPRRFPFPDRFDPMREDNEHLGFGSGIHTCFGGPLARLEINAALEVFLRRVKAPRLVVDPPPYRHNQVFRGPRHLWVDFAEIL
ncbi:cytochrome P450 [Mycolicibacterium sp.]|uniref:cytochrome P450 n=1 Tax=Mycolicibacterium sp. TaxID=2320850 RepID=UPI001DFCB2EE|nr:cytochrome P450 [Mycolicibacterium sp.]MCB1291063.1 cytochrome P450 [Mycobacterium sp.]MCB9409726.1 cytochrome P450 [Mycolicibacterium sp.]